MRFFRFFFLFLKKFTIDVAIIHDHEDRESFVIQDMSSNYRILKSRCKLEDGGQSKRNTWDCSKGETEIQFTEVYFNLQRRFRILIPPFKPEEASGSSRSRLSGYHQSCINTYQQLLLFKYSIHKSPRWKICNNSTRTKQNSFD